MAAEPRVRQKEIEMARGIGRPKSLLARRSAVTPLKSGRRQAARHVRFVATGWPYRRPIRTTAISAISRGSLMPVGGLNVAAIAFGLAACAVTFAVVELVDGALHWIENRRAPQPDEAQLLLAALCEQLHERLQQDGTPPRTVINLTAAQWPEVTKP